MSKIKENLIEKVIDNYKEHKFHNEYDSKCSTCYEENKEYNETHSSCCDSSIINSRCNDCKENI